MMVPRVPNTRRLNAYGICASRIVVTRPIEPSAKRTMTVDEVVELPRRLAASREAHDLYRRSRREAQDLVVGVAANRKLDIAAALERPLPGRFGDLDLAVEHLGFDAEHSPVAATTHL